MAKDQEYIETPPEGADGWRDVWLQRKRYRSRVAPLLFDWVTRTFETLLHPHLNRQRDFNIVVTDLIRDVREDVAGLRNDYRSDLEALRAEIVRLNELIPVASRRNDALIAALDQKIEALASRSRDLSARELVHSSPAFRSNFAYRRLEDALRGPSSEIRQHLTHYAELAVEHQPVIDLGCGRGEFLELCRERGVQARGFDTNEQSIWELKKKGLAVSAEPIPVCLRNIESESVGMIFASHVVEHLPFDILVDLFAAAARVLRKGGILAIETPNAESLAMSASDFWRDPTHLGLRHVAALTTLGREFSFDVMEARAVHEFPEARKLAAPDDSLQPLVKQLNDLLFAPADLRVVLRRV